MIKKLFIVCVISSIIFLGAFSKSYAAKNAGEKLVRGTFNVWTGQYDFFDNVHNDLYYKGPLGLFTGVAKGIGAMTVRMVGGVYDILTFWIPIPENYDPVVKPELNF
ncbi:exosortase system-associated protein, TIGR04073 family [bacterium]|nr:exosortase system-associated protein, TIGR04073 family [bacterium]